MELSFHPAEAGDAETLLGLMQEFYQEDNISFDAGNARAALEPLLGSGAWGRVWVIRVGDVAAGYAVLTLGYSLEFGGHDAFVDELFVRPAYRGLGLGREALAVIERACRELGVRALHLEVGRGNARAQALYQQAGFADRGHFLLTRRLDSAADSGDSQEELRGS
jgi:GNAT superfamily N-acetyltransferase